MASREQNKLTKGMAIKANFDIEYDSLKKKFKRKEYSLKIEKIIENALLESIGKPKPQEVFEFSELTIYTFFADAYNNLIKVDDYNFDYSNHRDSPLMDAKYYEKRNTDYLAITYFLNAFALHGSSKIRLLVSFIVRINNSNLIEDDRLHFKLRIADELVSTYFKFFDFYRRAPSQFMIPLIFLPKEDNKIEWIPFAFSEIGKQYDFFNEELRLKIAK